MLFIVSCSIQHRPRFNCFAVGNHTVTTAQSSSSSTVQHKKLGILCHIVQMINSSQWDFSFIRSLFFRWWNSSKKKFAIHFFSYFLLVHFCTDAFDQKYSRIHVKRYMVKLSNVKIDSCHWTNWQLSFQTVKKWVQSALIKSLLCMKSFSQSLLFPFIFN